MKKILLVLLILMLVAAPAYARYPGPKGYQGTWRVVRGKIVRQPSLEFRNPAPAVEDLTKKAAGTATRYEYFVDGNYYCAYNKGWKGYYICGANDGSDFFCKYYTDGSIVCLEVNNGDTN